MVAKSVVRKDLTYSSNTLKQSGRNSEKTALETQFTKTWEAKRKGLGFDKAWKKYRSFSGEDEFGYYNTFMNFTKLNIVLGWYLKTNTEVSNQANLANSSSSAIEQEIKIQQ